MRKAYIQNVLDRSLFITNGGLLLIKKKLIKGQVVLVKPLVDPENIGDMKIEITDLVYVLNYKDKAKIRDYLLRGVQDDNSPKG